MRLIRPTFLFLVIFALALTLGARPQPAQADDLGSIADLSGSTPTPTPSATATATATPTPTASSTPSSSGSLPDTGVDASLVAGAASLAMIALSTHQLARHRRSRSR